ncbi:hypothetical protein FE236_00385 [Mariprofundus erugo]|uniref:hypothetical protein n=1 Tax=Mariprofundus erugo TaxID=2528639 RepID=UPI0010FDE73C|nr:hypothetical protein [Mariprofundus erugo]TLS78251.1 hypothetical protein FE236_00385 [Mariprofundus erugo]
MKKSVMMIGLSSALLLGGMNLAVAGDKKEEAKGISPAAIEQLNMINKLVALGDARHDPLLLIAAAKLQKEMSDEAVGAPNKSVATDDVLARAKSLANGRKDIAGLADDVAAEKSKGYYSNGYYHSSNGYTYRSNW